METKIEHAATPIREPAPEPEVIIENFEDLSEQRASPKVEDKKEDAV